MALMGGREVMSTHVAAKAVPFDGTPPSIAVPYLVLVEYYNIRAVGRYLCDGVKSRSRSTSQFQLIVWRNVNHVSLHEMFWMNEHPCSVGIEASVASGVPAGIQPVKVWSG
jgi:hypothetical protein